MKRETLNAILVAEVDPEELRSGGVVQTNVCGTTLSRL